MPYRYAALALLATALLAAAPAPKSKPLAPETLAHANALFLRTLSNDGKQAVQFKAAAVGTHFFFEEAAGVTVYAFDGTDYKRVEFLKGAKLAAALKKYK